MSSRDWIVHASLFPSAVGVWGDQVSIDLTTRLPPPSEVTAIRIRNASVPYIVYNVLTANQTVELTIGGIVYTVLVTPGYYSGASLLTAIKNLLATAIALTPYVIDLTFSAVTYLTTITLVDTGAPPPGYFPFTLSTPLVAPVTTPSILTMLGFATNPLVSLTGNETSGGPLNVISDRELFITCDQARGAMGRIDSLAGPTWHQGAAMRVEIPTSASAGDVINYAPESNAPWITLVRGNTAGAITFRLSRTDFSTMGPTQVSWVMTLEVRL
ncbi:MAG: hypothetical protein WC483_00360 [Candidatus Paceibacterota bacterium]